MMFSPDVVIVDYHLSNLFSVKKACEYVGLRCETTSDWRRVMSADALILPGVGSFGGAMQNLRKLNLIEPLRDAIGSGKPTLGVCLGLQLLFERSEEFGEHEGLGLVRGDVRRIPKVTGDKRRKVPQINWNRVYQVNDSHPEKKRILEHIRDVQSMYFVHSYYVSPADTSIELTYTEYEGFRYCSSILKENIAAFQFHPEKSGVPGLGIYKNWAYMMSGCCGNEA